MQNFQYLDLLSSAWLGAPRASLVLWNYPARKAVHDVCYQLLNINHTNTFAESIHPSVHNFVSLIHFRVISVKDLAPDITAFTVMSAFVNQTHK